jgi:hypothetical protein
MATDKGWTRIVPKRGNEGTRSWLDLSSRAPDFEILAGSGNKGRITELKCTTLDIRGPQKQP